MAKIYYRLMLGPAGCYASESLKNNYIGVDFNVNEDLSGKFPEDWRRFNERYIPVYLVSNPRMRCLC